MSVLASSLAAMGLGDMAWTICLAAILALPLGGALLLIVLLFKWRRQRSAASLAESSRSGWDLLAAIAISVAAGVLTSQAIRAGAPYGWALFVGLPFFVGLASSWIYGYKEARSLRDAIAVSCFSMTLVGGVLIASAVEGAICLIMAAPIAYVAAIIGAIFGHLLQRGVETPGPATTLLLFLFIVPLTMGAESAAHLAPPEWIVHTTIEIDAPPKEVWKHVIEFPAAPPPHELAFRAGIAYPIRAVLHGSGVGAMRSCDFSTGSFIETIDAWEPGRRMEFSIVAAADPMTEMTPYPAIHPPHLDGYLHPRHAIFELTPLPGGRTRLEGTSFYRNQIWPANYWRVWSDAIIHTIHRRVFEHIKRLSESGQQRLLPLGSSLHHIPIDVEQRKR